MKKREKPYTIEVGPVISAIIGDIRANVPPAKIASRFHNTVIDIGAKVAADLARESQLRNVVLSGGVFQNKIIREGLVRALKTRGLNPVVPRATPVHDGCIALGQAVVAGARG